MLRILGAVAAAGLLAACAYTPIEREAAAGAAVGAAAGAAIGNNVGDGDARRGAAIGAAVGGMAGQAIGTRRHAGKCFSKPRTTEPLLYDGNTGRFYYVEEATGHTYYENGDNRTC